jgi:Transposase DDE domain
VTIPKKRLQSSVSRFKQFVADQPCATLGEAIPTARLASIVNAKAGAYRERLYPPLTTLGLFIEQSLSADGSCQDAVARHLSACNARETSPCSLNTGPYCKARQRLPFALIEQLHMTIGAHLEQAAPSHWRWRGRSVKLLDGTTVSMPDTKANQAAYPQSGEQKPGLGFPVAQLVGLISLATGAVLGVAMGSTKGKGSGEQALFRELMPQLDGGDVILVDRYHCTYFTLAMLMARGVDILTRQHQLRLTSPSAIVKTMSGNDHLVKWRRPQRPTWMTIKQYAAMPDELIVRQTAVGGRLLVTTLTDARRVCAGELDQLYRKRWQIEVDFRSIKSEIGMDILRGKSPEMTRKEVAVHLLAYNLIRSLMARAAALAHVLPRALSFKATLQLWQAFSQQWRWHPSKATCDVIATMLGAISTRTIAYRPNRVEPRAIKRRPTTHAYLTVPRDQARAAILNARNSVKVVP